MAPITGYLCKMWSSAAFADPCLLLICTEKNICHHFVCMSQVSYNHLILFSGHTGLVCSHSFVWMVVEGRHLYINLWSNCFLASPVIEFGAIGTMHMYSFN